MPDSDPLSTEVDRFVSHLRSEQRASPHTISAYGRDLHQFVIFARERMERPSLSLSDIDIFVLRGWLGSLARTQAPSSVARKVASVRSLFRFAFKRGVVSRNPASELATPKIRRGLPTMIDVDAAKQVMEAPSRDTASDLRDHAIRQRVPLAGCGDPPAQRYRKGLGPG